MAIAIIKSPKVQIDFLFKVNYKDMPIQSEAALENGLIATLQKMNYEYVHIEEEKNLSANFKRQLE